MRFALAMSALLVAAPAGAAAPREVVVQGTRVHAIDVLPSALGAAGSVDIGPSPTAGGSRIVTRAEIEAAFAAKQLPTPPAIPDVVRVVRKTRRLAPADLEALVRGAIATRPLGKGVRLAAVRTDHPTDVAEGWARVDVDVPRAPKRVGAFVTTAIASFFSDEGEVTARVPIPVELAISEEGATYDSARGGAVTLIVRRGYIEVRAAGVAMADADIGDVVPVQLRASGRVLRGRLVARDEAVALEDGQ